MEDEKQADAIDKRLREAHRDLTEDLRDILDIEAGLRDLLDRAKRDE
jgi:hypothetical protein